MPDPTASRADNFEVQGDSGEPIRQREHGGTWHAAPAQAALMTIEEPP
jgi:hypothetical protein